MNIFKNDLLDFELVYKDVLDIPDWVKFGIEIEFSDAKIDDVRRVINKNFVNGENLPWVVKGDASVRTEIFLRNSRKNIYQNMDASWDDPRDLEVLCEHETIVCGGEVNTPILTDTLECWRSLRKACSLLRCVDNISINDKCSVHFHTDDSIFKNQIQLFRFLKIWMLYEDIIYRFGYGIKNFPRSTIMKYAKPINEIIFNNLSDPKIFDVLGGDRRVGFNLSNVLKKSGKSTYEDRVCNGSLYEVIIQNSFEFFIRLKLLCRNESFDWDFIDYKVSHFSPIAFASFINEDCVRANELSSMVYKNEYDRLRFMKQYLKSFDDNDIRGFEKVYYL